MRLDFVLNGEPVTLETEPTALLLDVLREQGLLGTKEGCGVGVCGLCSVLVDDKPVSSCLTLAGVLQGAQIWSVEGLVAADPGLAAAFVEREGMQCGICTPGQVVAAAALARRMPDATLEEVRDELAGNLCRCTGYGTILEAVMTYLNRA